MKLIKVEAKGFKSFAEKVILNFNGGIVGIVGPNGSGKSNINDAIKWVLGETSVKSLRGKLMEDIIFSGSKTVKSMNRAEVSLTFDNFEKTISIPHKKFTISRVLTRGKGTNEYFINGEHARLKDIKAIAMESGMAKSSLAIISQGTIQNIAQSTPLERRAIFEEAAGVSKYKSHKINALKKLDKTTEALDKIKTIIYELKKQLVPLKKQANKAKIYLEKANSLKKVEISLIVEDVQFFEKKFKQLSIVLKDVVSTKEDLNARISKSEKEIKSKNFHKLTLENDILNLTNKFQEISDKLRDVSIKESQISQKRQMIIEGQIKSSDSSRLETMKEELKEMKVKISKYNHWEEKNQSHILNKKSFISKTQTNISNLSIEIDKLKNNLLKLKTQITILKDYQYNKTHLFKGTKTIIENASLFNGFQGIIADLIVVEDQYKIGIEAILKNALQHVVVDNPESAVKAINFLKNNNGGQATFIPLSSIKPKKIKEEHLMIINNLPGFIGMGENLVSVLPKYEILKKFLLGNIIFANTINDTNYISQLLNKKYMVVSLDGDIVRIGGIIFGGAIAKTRNILGIDEKIKKFLKAIPDIENDILNKTIEINKLSSSITENQTLVMELSIEIAKAKEKKSIVESQFSTMKIQYELESKEKFIFKKAIKIIDNVDSLEVKKSSIQATLKAKRESIMNINNDISILTTSKIELEKSLRNIIEFSTQKITEKNQANFIIKSSKQRLLEEYEMTIEFAKEKFHLEINRKKAKIFVSQLRHEIKELGPINIESIKSFEKINERFTKLKSSEEELFSAQ